MLIHFGVKPYLVFDGDNLPSKADTEVDRHKKRQESKTRGLELHRKGKIAEAYQELQKAVDVTPCMARQLIEELKKLEVPYIVAPYEADAQLVYLETHGIINGIISEDSDLLVFGAKKLLSKLDQHGDCIELNRSDFTACREVSFVGWTDADFRRMCILSGCDYLPSIARMGLKTAYRSIRKYKSVERALRMLQFEGQYIIPPTYLEQFKQAEFTFLYQRVFCPRAGKLVTLTPLEPGIALDDLPFIGDDVEPQLAVGVACGDLHPATKLPIELQNVAPKRTALAISRRQTFGSSAELKSPKPISSFFTPKRVPLAELDPNSLTPSPSQQRLLEQHANSSWVARSAQPRVSLTRSNTSLATSASVSRQLAPNAERRMAQAAKAANAQATKRPRLCSDAEIDGSPSGPNGRSRFFEDNSLDLSSPAQKSGRAKKSSNSMLHIFSDDQVAEKVFSRMSDSDLVTVGAQEDHDSKLSTKANSQIHTQKEEPQKDTNCAAEPADEVAEKTRSIVEAASVGKQEQERKQEKSDKEQGSPGKSAIIEPNPEISQTPLDKCVEKQAVSIFSRYSLGSKNASPEDQPAPVNDFTARSSAAPSAGLLWGYRENSTKRQRLTPLQRLGHNALSRSRTVNIPSTMRPARNSPFRANQTGAPEHSTVRGSYFTPTSIHQGSEDLLVSPSDEESCDSVTSKQTRLTGLDLKRFSFVAG